MLSEKNIIAENLDWIALNKPATIPTQDDLTGDQSLHNWLQNQRPNTPIFVVHRLDRVAAGLVVFAKNESAAHTLSQIFQSRNIQKTYLAWVAAPPPQSEGQLVHFLKKTAKNKAILSQNPTKGFDRAALTYRQVGQSDRYFLLEIKLETGRFHQIRAQLAAIGCPIKGDVKYGARRANLDRSIHLFAWKLNAQTPKITLNLDAPFPNDPLWALAKNILTEEK